MAVTSADIKSLREKTGAGMLNCKKALVATQNNAEDAVIWLREKGLSTAAKKADRLATEGLLNIQIGTSKAVLLEINSETDFVAKNETFISLVNNVTKAILDNEITTVEELNGLRIENEDFSNYLSNQIATIGENIVIRRFDISIADSDTVMNGYVHSNGKVATVISAKIEGIDNTDAVKELLKNIAMHAAAMKPTVLSYKDLDAEFVAKEVTAIRADIEKTNIELHRLGKPEKKVPDFVSKSQLSDEVLANAKASMEADLKSSGKPEKIWDKIIPGQIARFISDNSSLDQKYALLSQAYVMNDKQSIEEAIEEKAKALGGKITLSKYVRYELGEGLEKKACDFASEVAEALK